MAKAPEPEPKPVEDVPAKSTPAPKADAHSAKPEATPPQKEAPQEKAPAPVAKAPEPPAEKPAETAPKQPEAKEVPAAKAPEKADKEPASEQPKAQEQTSTTPKTEATTTNQGTDNDQKQAPPAATEAPQGEASAELPENKKSKVKSKDTVALAKAESGSSRGVIEAKADTLKGLTVLGKIELPSQKKKEKPIASSDDAKDKRKKKRPRKRMPGSGPQGQGGQQGQGQGGQRQGQGQGQGGQRQGQGPGGQRQGPGGQRQGQGGPGRGPRHGNDPRGGRGKLNQRRGQQAKKPEKEELTDKQVQDKIKATLAKLSGGGSKGGANRSKYRREKRSAIAESEHEKAMQAQEDAKTLKVTEFISANDLASLIGVSVNEIISTCMSLGMFVSINQRLDAESITVISDEFGYNVDFTSSDEETAVEVVEDEPEDLEDRAPIVTIMGHVDHGKTSLLDYIRNAKVTEGEAGGITQHIGAYDVMTNSGKRIAFLDTPGHEAFTAMRARGAKVTDVVIIVIAADDSVMPQTKEAINHAQVAGVPIVIAMNKIDKPNANPDKIREELSNINILVEEWGGKYQSQEISAKSGLGIDELLEKVLLEAELLELKANYERRALGTVIEASLDKGRGYVATMLVENGTLNIGDVMLAGAHYGKVKAMFDHRGHNLQKAGPATPVLVLGLDGAPQAGDKLNVLESDREAREIATKRAQINREQSIRTKKHITLDEIGRRLAIGSFKELNVIVKGDVDGSVEALSDSLLKLSTEEVQVSIIHKAVGQISESDVLLASASDAIIVGFQVRPSPSARRLAENEEIEIRLYSVIYDAINEVKDAMEGMLSPTVEEIVTGNVDVREVFKISKVGTVAGCMVTDGLIKRNSQIRLVRDGIVVYTGEIMALKRFKEDVNEVKNGFECGISIRNFNDIKVGDNIECFEEREVKRTL